MQLILVTGAPRSGTTPVGAALALAPGARMIYEPMGPTGDRRIPSRFAIPGEPGFPPSLFEEFVRDLAALRLRLGTQQRKSYWRLSAAQRLARSFVGSRTRSSYLATKLAFNLRTLVWKDPMAALAVPSVLSLGIPTVICLRDPLATAASFKRRGWKGDASSVYPRFRDNYGAVPAIERLSSRIRTMNCVGNAAMLWHMVYLLAHRVVDGQFGSLPGNLHLVSGAALETDEINVYRQTFEVLDLPFDGRPRRRLEARVRQAVHEAGDPARVHDWQRTLSATNSYWSDVLSAEEVELVQELNLGIYNALESLRASARLH